MSAISDLIDKWETAFRRYQVGGIASSGPNKPNKLLVEQLGQAIADAITEAGAGGTGAIVYSTVANLSADLNHDANTMAWVVADPGGDNENFNGIWRKNGAAATGSWTWLRLLNDVELGLRLDALEAINIEDRLAALEASENENAPFLLAYRREMTARPGDAPNLFMDAYTGSPDASAQTVRTPVSTANGKVIQIAASGILARRGMVRTEPNRKYLVRAVVQRAANPVDPNNDAVELGMAWFTNAGDPVPGTPVTVLGTFAALTVASGRTQKQAIVALSSAEDVTIVAPETTVYARPYVRAYGSDGLTNVEVVETKDVTDSIGDSIAESLVQDAIEAVAQVQAIETVVQGLRDDAVDAAASAGADLWTRPVASIEEELPDTPSLGDRVLLDATEPTHPNQIAEYFADGWHFSGSPRSGQRVTVSPGLPYEFNGVEFNPPSEVYPEWFGALGDGVTDDSIAMQACIDWVEAHGGGIVQALAKIYVCNIIVKVGVTLRGSQGGYGYLGGDPSPLTTFKAAGTGIVIDTPTVAGGVYYKGIHLSDFNVLGLGSGVPLKGVNVRDGAYWCSAKRIHTMNTADQGFYSAADSHACVFEDILVVGALLNQTRTEIAAAAEIHGVDHWVSRVEAGCGQTTLSTNFDMGSEPPVFTAGVWLDSGSDFNVSQVAGEASDIGLYTTGSAAGYSQCFPNFNFAHGWVDKSGNYTQMVNCKSLNNGRAAASTYDAFYRLPGGGAINVSDFAAYSPGGTNAARYAINDQVGDSASDAIRARYSGVRTVGNFTKTYNFVATFAGPEVVISDGPMHVLPVNDATPSVDNYRRFTITNANPTTITNFDDGVSGQEISVRISDTNTAIQQGTPIKMLNGSDITGPGVYTFVLWNNVWFQTAGSGAQRAAVVTYSASMTPNLARGLSQQITVTDGSAFAINNPTNPTSNGEWTLEIINASGGAVGAITLGSAFRAAGFTAPADAKLRFYRFRYDGTDHILISQSDDQ